MVLRKEKYGKVIQHFNFNMPFTWNREKFNDWSHVESLHKEIEVESAWRDYFTANGNNKEANKSYWRAQALKKALNSAIQKEQEKLSQQYIKK